MIDLFRPSREARGEDPWLNAKVAIFCIGAVIALIGVATNTSWVITVAIGVLIVGFLMRFLRPRGDRPHEEEKGDASSS